MHETRKNLFKHVNSTLKLAYTNQPFFTFLLFVIFGTLLSERFFSLANLLNVFRQASLIFSFSVGMTITMLLAGLDLSIGAIGALTSVLAATLIRSGQVASGILVALCTGLFLGTLSGIAIAKFAVPSFIMTFGMSKIANGLALEYTQGESIYGFSDAFRWLGIGTIGTIPVPLVLNVLLLFILAYLTKKTVFGRSIYAVGDNIVCSRFSGIPVQQTIIAGYAISGLFSAFAGLLFIARLGSAEGVLGETWPQEAIAACVLGGVSFAGGKGSIVGTAFGALSIAILYNVLNLLGIDPAWQEFATGFIIIFVISLDSIKTLIVERRKVIMRIRSLELVK